MMLLIRIKNATNYSFCSTLKYNWSVEKKQIISLCFVNVIITELFFSSFVFVTWNKLWHFARPFISESWINFSAFYFWKVHLATDMNSINEKLCVLSSKQRGFLHTWQQAPHNLFMFLNYCTILQWKNTFNLIKSVDRKQHPYVNNIWNKIIHFNRIKWIDQKRIKIQWAIYYLLKKHLCFIFYFFFSIIR